MKTLIDIDNWNRKEHFQFFSKFDEPFFGVTVKVDCTTAYKKAKENGLTTVMAYICEAQKDTKGSNSSFSL